MPFSLSLFFLIVLITFQVTIYVLSISLPIVTFLPYKQKNVMRPEIFFLSVLFIAGSPALTPVSSTNMFIRRNI